MIQYFALFAPQMDRSAVRVKENIVTSPQQSRERGRMVGCRLCRVSTKAAEEPKSATLSLSHCSLALLLAWALPLRFAMWTPPSAPRRSLEERVVRKHE